MSVKTGAFIIPDKMKVFMREKSRSIVIFNIKKFCIKVLPLLFFIIFFSAYSPNEQPSVRQIVTNMSASVQKIKTLRFKLKKKERIDNEIILGEQDCKFNRHPLKVYTKIISPKEGAEVLYIEGANKNKALVNPNSFPYITLSLDPYGSVMRNNNHHTVFEVGFDYINSIVSHIIQKAGTEFDRFFIYKGDTVFNNRKCYKVLIDYIPFGYYNYTVKEGETVTSIAYKFFVSDYMILQLNKNVDDYEDIDAGDVIRIPNAYARKTLLYIDKETYLPLVQIMYDDKGLFSQYEFYDLQLNPSISPEEFTRGYKEYHFD